MSNINKVVVSGRLTRDPELRSTMGGTTVMTMSIANNERRRNQQTQQWEDYVNYFDCTVFGQRAEFFSRNLKKGMLICVEGRLRWSSWERDGQKRSKIEILVDDIEFMSPLNPGGSQIQSDDSYAQSYAQPQAYIPTQASVPMYTAQPVQMSAQTSATVPMTTQMPMSAPMSVAAQMPAQTPVTTQVPTQAPVQTPVSYAAPAQSVQQPPMDQVYDEDIPF
ncbi:MAG: single-stranded DNA-binding protein [Coriobacteriales bacterium]|nr:single-stranded DNA-binding protein [Coriobacteriales bacterium]